MQKLEPIRFQMFKIKIKRSPTERERKLFQTAIFDRKSSLLDVAKRHKVN